MPLGYTTLDTASTAPITLTVAPSPAPAAVLQDARFSRVSKAFATPAGAEAAPARS